MIDHYNFEDRKLVEIVKATYFDPKIVVIDETTTALSQEGREELTNIWKESKRVEIQLLHLLQVYLVKRKRNLQRR